MDKIVANRLLFSVNKKKTLGWRKKRDYLNNNLQLAVNLVVSIAHANNIIHCHYD